MAPRVRLGKHLAELMLRQGEPQLFVRGQCLWQTCGGARLQYVTRHATQSGQPRKFEVSAQVISKSHNEQTQPLLRQQGSSVQ
jgi:hypothetical protein